MGFNVWCYLPINAVKLANFFYVYCFRRNTVKCLEGSSDIFGNNRTSSLVYGNLLNNPELS